MKKSFIPLSYTQNYISIFTYVARGESITHVHTTSSVKRYQKHTALCVLPK